MANESKKNFRLYQINLSLGNQHFQGVRVVSTSLFTLISLHCCCFGMDRTVIISTNLIFILIRVRYYYYNNAFVTKWNKKIKSKAECKPAGCFFYLVEPCNYNETLNSVLKKRFCSFSFQSASQLSLQG